MSQRLLLRAVVTNDPPFVLATRKYLGELILQCFDQSHDLPYAERLSNAAAELLENALKYSPPGSDLAVSLIRTPVELQLRIGNELREEGRAVVRAVRREIRAVWAAGDAKEVFRKKVLASLADPTSKAMLGYAKIRMETGGQLRARLGRGGRLDVILTFPLVPVRTAQPV